MTLWRRGSVVRSGFQILAAATGKARLTTVESLKGGTTRRLMPEEQGALTRDKECYYCAENYIVCFISDFKSLYSIASTVTCLLTSQEIYPRDAMQRVRSYVFPSVCLVLLPSVL